MQLFHHLHHLLPLLLMLLSHPLSHLRQLLLLIPPPSLHLHLLPPFPHSTRLQLLRRFPLPRHQLKAASQNRLHLLAVTRLPFWNPLSHQRGDRVLHVWEVEMAARAQRIKPLPLLLLRLTASHTPHAESTRPRQTHQLVHGRQLTLALVEEASAQQLHRHHSVLTPHAHAYPQLHTSTPSLHSDSDSPSRHSTISGLQ